MSLILDALRKMELELKAKRLSSAEIRTEVLNYRGNPHTPKKYRLLPIIAVLLLGSSLTALFLYFKGSPAPGAESVKKGTPLPVDNQAHSNVKETATLPLPSVQTTQRAEENRPSEVPRPTAKTEEFQQPSGDDINIVVSGIAWQEERPLRRAVINGSLVSEGAEVSGVKVVEIRENFVRFSQRGRNFEVIYPSGSAR